LDTLEVRNAGRSKLNIARWANADPRIESAYSYGWCQTAGDERQPAGAQYDSQTPTAMSASNYLSISQLISLWWFEFEFPDLSLQQPWQFKPSAPYLCARPGTNLCCNSHVPNKVTDLPALLGPLTYNARQASLASCCEITTIDLADLGFATRVIRGRLNHGIFYLE
jgi:hypothetical protein